ncbi:transcriptional regulator swi6, partial [Spiromyces aspiralis]
ELKRVLKERKREYSRAKKKPTAAAIKRKHSENNLSLPMSQNDSYNSLHQPYEILNPNKRLRMDSADPAPQHIATASVGTASMLDSIFSPSMLMGQYSGDIYDVPGYQQFNSTQDTLEDDNDTASAADRETNTDANNDDNNNNDDTEAPQPLLAQDAAVVSAAAPNSDQLRSDNATERDRKLLRSMFLQDDPNYIPDWLASLADAPYSQQDMKTSQDRPSDIDLVIDDQGHTPVHWAAALGRVQILDLLLACGADARRLNFAGESALIRAVKVTNNYDSQTFQDLLELLHDAIPLTDKSNRTVLHHICLAAAEDDHEKASHYYLESLLVWIAGLANGYDVLGPEDKDQFLEMDSSPTQNRRRPSSQRTGDGSVIETLGAPPGNSQSTSKEESLAPPVTGSKSENSGAAIGPEEDPANADNSATSAVAPVEGTDQDSGTLKSRSPGMAISNADFAAFLDLQDHNGDTAFNIAARIGDRELIRLFLGVKASPYVANRVGLRPADYGVLSMDFGGEAASENNNNNNISATLSGTPTRPMFTGFAQSPLANNSDSAKSPTVAARSGLAVRKFSGGAVTPLRPSLTANFQMPPQTEPIRRGKSASQGLFGALRSNMPEAHGIRRMESVSRLGNDALDSADDNDMWGALHRSRVRNLMKNIQSLVEDLDGEFQDELRVKQERFAIMQRQLKAVTSELTEARETIHTLNAQVSQLNEAKSRVKLLEEALRIELEQTRSALSDVLSEGDGSAHLSAITTPNCVNPRDLIKNLTQQLFSDATAGTTTSDAAVPADLHQNNSDELPPEKLREEVRVLQRQVKAYMYRDALLRERLEVVRRRADMSEKERQYRKIIASCCELSEEDVDLWIDRLVNAVESEDTVESNTQISSGTQDSAVIVDDQVKSPLVKGLNLH